MSLDRPLGITEAGPPRLVAQSVGSARTGLLLLGPSGSGKSTAELHIGLAEMSSGRGLAVVEPKDLVDELLRRIPRSRIPDVVLMDPREADAPPSMNVLDTSDAPAHVVADNIVAAFAALAAGSWGPRSADLLRSICLTAMLREDATLLDAAELLTNAGLRRDLIAQLGDNDALCAFWQWYESLTPSAQGQVAAPLQNKLRSIFLRPFARDVLGSARSSFSMTDVLDGGILLARLPKGELGEDASRIIGSLVLSKIWQAATARASLPESARRDCTALVDEAHNFLALPGALEDVLAETRGYHLSFVLAHQHVAQLPRSLWLAISANVRSKMIFAPSPEDARMLARHTMPVLDADDLTRLGAYRVAVRLLERGQLLPAFTLSTLPPPPAVPGRAEQVRAASRTTYGITQDERRRARLARRLPGNLPGTSVGTPDLPPSETPFAQANGTLAAADDDPDWWSK